MQARPASLSVPNNLQRHMNFSLDTKKGEKSKQRREIKTILFESSFFLSPSPVLHMGEILGVCVLRSCEIHKP